MMENPGYRTGSLDSLHHPSDDDDDEMVDIAGATLDFSTTDDDPPLSSGNCADIAFNKVKTQLDEGFVLSADVGKLFA